MSDRFVHIPLVVRFLVFVLVIVLAIVSWVSLPRLLVRPARLAISSFKHVLEKALPYYCKRVHRPSLPVAGGMQIQLYMLQYGMCSYTLILLIWVRMQHSRMLR